MSQIETTTINTPDFLVYGPDNNRTYEPRIMLKSKIDTYCRERRPYPTGLANLLTPRTPVSTIHSTPHITERLIENYYGPGQDYYEYQPLNPAFLTNGIDDFLPYTDWITPLKTKIKNKPVNLGQHLVEFDKTCVLFYEGAVTLHKAWHAFRRWSSPRQAAASLVRKRRNRYKKRPTFTTDDISASHLMNSFTISPVLGDIDKHLSAIQHRLSSPIYERYVVTSSDMANYHISSQEQWNHQSQRAIFYVQFDPEKSAEFSWGNPFELAYERVAFSFVVDWAINIGGYLSALDALINVKDMLGTVTTKNVKESLRDQDLHVIQRGRWQQRDYKREVFNSIGDTPLPRYSPNKSLRSVVTGLALLHQLRSSKGRLFR